MPWELAETREFTMTAIESTAFGRLESEGRLLKPAHKAPTKQAGRFGFRGEIAVSLDPPVNLEAAFASARGVMRPRIPAMRRQIVIAILSLTG